MSTVVSSHKAIRIQSRSIGLSAVPIALTAAMPKCPLCWAALMSAVGVGSAINFQWLHPMAVMLLLVSVGASYFSRATPAWIRRILSDACCSSNNVPVQIQIELRIWDLCQWNCFVCRFNLECFAKAPRQCAMRLLRRE